MTGERRYEELARALDEDGDPGIDLLAGLYPSVAALVAERDRLRTVIEAVRPYVTLLPVEVAEGIVGIEPVEYADQERDRMRAALGDISRVVMPDIGHGGNYGFVVAATERAVAERDRLRATIDAAREFSAAHNVWMAKAREAGVSPVDQESRRRAATLAALLDLVDQLDAEEGT